MMALDMDKFEVAGLKMVFAISEGATDYLQGYFE